MKERDINRIELSFENAYTNYSHRHANIELCKSCNEELGLQKFLNENQYKNVDTDESYAGKLYAILKEVVQSCVTESNVD